jgi:hypothetical protein
MRDEKRQEVDRREELVIDAEARVEPRSLIVEPSRENLGSPASRYSHREGSGRSEPRGLDPVLFGVHPQVVR